MKINMDENTKRCEIWVSHQEKASYKAMPLYLDTIAKAKEESYSICIFLGGTAPFLPLVSALLDQQAVAKIS